MMPTPNKPYPQSFRIYSETEADLLLIAQHLAGEKGGPPNRSEALRWAVRQAADRLRKKIPKNSAN